MRHILVAIALSIIYVTNSFAATMLVGWDGADYRIVKKLADEGKLPNLQRLNWGHLTITSVTVTCPGWSEQLSGLPWYVIGTIQNGATCKTIPAGKTVFEWAKLFGLSSAFISGKTVHVVTTPGGSFANVPAVSTIIINAPAWIDQFGDLCLEAARTHNFVFCHSKEPDTRGHLGGMFDGLYVDRVIKLDIQLGRYLAAGHTVLVTSDHGFEMPSIPPNVPTPVYSTPYLTYGYSHTVEANAIIGANVDIDLTRPIGLDVFPTIVDMLGLPPAWWTPKELGKSLIIH